MKNISVIGTGLVALDVILNGSPKTPPKISAGGSCGNVLTILSYLGFDCFPISRLADNHITELLLKDFEKWNVNTSLISKKSDGSTPIIIHRILRDKFGKPQHRFEFRNPYSGNWLPSYKPLVLKNLEDIYKNIPDGSNIFYFDRLNPSAIELAKRFYENGALVIFEPSSIKEIEKFKKCLKYTHILKFSNERINNFSEIFPTRQVPLEIETLGKDGLRFRYESNHWMTNKSFEVDEISDTAGAGDWSTSGIISILGKNGLDTFNNANAELIQQAISFGQALGALNCMFDGARGLMYNLEKEKIEDIVYKLFDSGNIKAEEITKLKEEYYSNPDVKIESIFNIE